MLTLTLVIDLVLQFIALRLQLHLIFTKKALLILLYCAVDLRNIYDVFGWQDLGTWIWI